MAFDAQTTAELYETAVEPDGLERMSGLVRRALDIDSAGFWLVREGAVVELSCTPDIRASEPAYLARYQTMDPWAVRDPAQFGQATLANELFDEARLIETEFYNDFARHYGMLRPMGVTIDLREGCLGVVAANRLEPGRLLDAADGERMQAMVVHLASALRLRLRFASLQAVAAIREEALDALAFPLVVCDRDGRVGFANRQAEHRSMHGGPLQLQRGRVDALLTGERSGVLAALRKASDGAGGGCLLTDANGERVSVTITPAPERIAGLPGRLLLSSPQIRRRDPDRLLREAYKLTPAQADLCCALADGKTFEEAATARGVAVSTMRTHFRSILRRTGATNLRDLLRMMASLPPVD